MQFCLKEQKKENRKERRKKSMHEVVLSKTTACIVCGRIFLLIN